MPAIFQDLCQAPFSENDFNNDRTIMPTAGILVFLHVCVPMLRLCYFPVSHQPTAIWCQSPPFDRNNLPISVPVTALLLHLKQTCIQSLQSSTYGQHLTSVKVSLPLLVRAPTSPGFPLASPDISSQSSLKRLFCIPKEGIFANPSLSSIGALPERPYVLHLQPLIPKALS